MSMRKSLSMSEETVVVGLLFLVAFDPTSRGTYASPSCGLHTRLCLVVFQVLN